MPRLFTNGKILWRKHIPGQGALKNFFQIHGPVETLKGMYFTYYSQYRLRKLALDPTKEHLVEVNNYHMFIIPSDKGISAELAVFHSHEPLATKVLSSQLRDGMVCLDIGSNIGYYALLASKLVGTRGEVICFEPCILSLQYLKRNLEMVGLSNTRTYNVAIGDVDDHASLLTDIRSNLCRIVEESEQLSMTTGQGDHNLKSKIKVPMKRIDSLIEDLGIEKLDFVRMDTEGYEANICQGMKSTITKFKPMLFIEFHRIFLGREKTRTLLLDLRDIYCYELLYYIPRWMDNPIIANTKYIKKITISDLLKKLDKDSLPGVFSLFLLPNSS